MRVFQLRNTLIFIINPIIVILTRYGIVDLLKPKKVITFKYHIKAFQSKSFYMIFNSEEEIL